MPKSIEARIKKLEAAGVDSSIKDEMGVRAADVILSRVLDGVDPRPLTPQEQARGQQFCDALLSESRLALRR